MCNFYQGITTHKNSYDFATISPIEVVSTKTAMKPAGAKLLDWIKVLEDLTASRSRAGPAVAEGATLAANAVLRSAVRAPAWPPGFLPQPPPRSLRSTS